MLLSRLTEWLSKRKKRGLGPLQGALPLRLATGHLGAARRPGGAAGPEGCWPAQGPQAGARVQGSAIRPNALSRSSGLWSKGYRLLGSDPEVRWVVA